MTDKNRKKRREGKKREEDKRREGEEDEEREHHREQEEEEEREGEEEEEREEEERRKHRPHRPGKHVGISRGQINGIPLTPGDFGPHPANSWPGQRINLFMPFLFMRANPGDMGTRPVVGPFWESPDIMVLPGIAPGSAPPIPSQLGQVAQANADNTIYAQIWNFGKSAAREVVVEFYWCNPAIGINPAGINLIAQTFTQLGARGSGDSHAVVKCPESWKATYVNGGHECLLVRAWDFPSDVLGTPEWDASLNRHLGQRNIHVVSAADPPSVTLDVGPLFGAAATVKVERVSPTSMPWLQLHGGVRGQFPLQAPPTGQPTLSPPQSIGAGPGQGQAGQQHRVKGDDKQVTLTTTDDPPGAGEAHVYRVSGQQGGQTFGGYTLVIVGS